MEIAGVGVIALGSAGVVAAALVRKVAAAGDKAPAARSAYSQVRQGVGRALLLGLEFLVGADIIRTVSEVPTMGGVLILGLIVLIRTFLSFTTTAELEGRWPWQKAES